jgi:hypothetical protein
MDAQDQISDLSRYLVFMHFVQLFRCNIVVLGYILLVPKVKAKAKFPLGHIMKAQRRCSGIPVLSLTLALDGDQW